MTDHAIPRPSRAPLAAPTIAQIELDPDLADDDERVPGLYSTSQPTLCGLCRSRIITAGRLRPWIDTGQPLCRDCTTNSGLADLEAILDALTAARRHATGDSTLRGAASAWAMHRLTTWIHETLEDAR